MKQSKPKIIGKGKTVRGKILVDFLTFKFPKNKKTN